MAIAVLAAAAVLQAWSALDAGRAIAVSVAAVAAAGLGLVQLHKARTKTDDHLRSLDEARAEQERLKKVASELRAEIAKAHRRHIEFNERALKRIGADLHDGPAQLLGLALLKLDELKPGLDARGRETLDLIRRASADALAEIRNTARGLVLPDIASISLASALELAARSHEQRTRTKVDVDIAPLPAQLPLPVTISLFRFVQEGLSNAYRHAGGVGQSLRAGVDDTSVWVEVSDKGPGFDPKLVEPRPDRLGLIGLSQRLQSLGGMLQINAAPGRGTCLRARFPLPEPSARD